MWGKVNAKDVKVKIIESRKSKKTGRRKDKILNVSIYKMWCLIDRYSKNRKISWSEKKQSKWLLNLSIKNERHLHTDLDPISQQ